MIDDRKINTHQTANMDIKRALCLRFGAEFACDPISVRASIIMNLLKTTNLFIN